MLQDIAPSKLDMEFRNWDIKENDKVFIFQDDQVVFPHNASDGLPLFTHPDLNKLFPHQRIQPIYLFSLDHQNYFLLTDAKPSLLETLHQLPVQIFRTMKPGAIAFAGITAYHLYKWYSNHRYCGHCGAIMQHSSTERAMSCPHCKRVVYPRISPAIIVGIINHDRLLMLRSAYGSYRKFALLAGFCEVGETLEETVEREVMEEVGLRVTNIRYYKTQPWGFSESLLVGFFADLDGEDQMTIDPKEVAEAQWFEREEIPPVELNISLTSEMIEAFRGGSIKSKTVESACHISLHI